MRRHWLARQRLVVGLPSLRDEVSTRFQRNPFVFRGDVVLVLVVQMREREIATRTRCAHGVDPVTPRRRVDRPAVPIQLHVPEHEPEPRCHVGRLTRGVLRDEVPRSAVGLVDGQERLLVVCHLHRMPDTRARRVFLFDLSDSARRCSELPPVSDSGHAGELNAVRAKSAETAEGCRLALPSRDEWGMIHDDGKARGHPSENSGAAIKPNAGREVPSTNVPWTVLSVGSDDHTLLLKYYWGGGYLDEPTVSLREGENAVEVAISLPDLTKDPATEAILTFAASSMIEVKLQKPVAGRRIRGAETLMTNAENIEVYRSVESDDTWLSVMPRVTDLAVEDARAILRAQGFETSVEGRGPRVVAQHPAPETVPEGQSGSLHGQAVIIAGQ